MTVEEIIKRIRALPVRLRFHLLFSMIITPEMSSKTLSLVDLHGEMLAELSMELVALPIQVRMLLIASELKQTIAG